MTVSMFEQMPVLGDTITPRFDHGAIVFRENLYVLLGNTVYDGYLGDMCWTNDLYRWHSKPSIVTTNGGTIQARSKFGLCEHDRKVYLTGGIGDSNRTRDVYVTEDMIRWKRLPDAPWSAREGHFQVSFNGKLWVMGGSESGIGLLSDVWFTENGVNWHRGKDTPWGARRYFEGINYNNRLYMAGGYAGLASQQNDVWYTDDGRNWVRMESDANFPPVEEHRLVIAKGNMNEARMFLVGGYYGSDIYATEYYSSDLWHSGDGHHWYKSGDMGINSNGIASHTANVFNGRIVVVGGYNDIDDEFGDVWASKNELFNAGEAVKEVAYAA